ncbi:MAG TPA: hypothetical protein VIJ60_08965 [Acidimicrobiales bacterium]|jgi:hypothetical protein
MSLWTPSGEHPVDRDDPADPPGDPAGGPGPGGGAGPVGGQPTVEELRRQLAEAPPEVVVANHCYGLFELAAVYLSQSPPLLDEARLAIDALGYVVEGLGERLGDAYPALKDGMAQLQLAFVQLGAAEEARQEAGNGSEP